MTAEGWITIAWAALLLGGTAVVAARRREHAGHRRQR
jgi:hypothetical protein